MCHDLDFDLLRQLQREEMIRRVREQGQRAPEKKETPAGPATPSPAVRDKEPVPA